MIIELPWFPKELHPNSGSHWRAKQGPKAKYREDCRRVCCGKVYKPEAEKIFTKIMFHPPRNAGDLDGFLAAAKNGIDGMCIALGINDKRLRPILLDVGDVHKGGKIVIEI